MSTEPTTAEKATHRFNAVVVTLISIVTVVSAVTAFLQNDASARSNTAIRDGQKFAVLQMEAALQVQQQQNYDAFVYQQWAGLSWERSLMLAKGDEAAATQDADRLTALMKRTAGFSPLTSPPYLTDPIEGTPDAAKYYAEQEYNATLYREQRDALTTAGNAWSDRAAAYVTILTLLAVSLFLFGLATTIATSMRRAFVALGSVIALAAMGWATINFVTPIPSRPEAAMQLLAKGHVEVAQAATLRSWGQASDAQPHFQIGIGLLDQALAIDPTYAMALQERASAYLQSGEQRVWDREDAAEFLKDAIRDYQAAIAHGDTSITSLWNLGWAYYLFGDQPESLAWTNRAIAAAPQQIGLYLNRAVALLALGRQIEANVAVQDAFDKAAALKISSANLYFRAAIHDTTKLLRAFYNSDLQALLINIKQKYVSLRYRKGAPVQPTGMRISSSAFFGRIDDQQLLQDRAETFAAGTQSVYFGFDYTGLKAGSEIEAVVYYNDDEDDSLTVLEKLNLGEQGTGYVRIESPFINSGGLASGQYRVDLHVEGELLASGEFEVK